VIASCCPFVLHCGVNLEDWIGRTETHHDVLTEAPLRGLAALFDRGETWTEVPPLAHWLYFLPTARQSEIAEDGHPKRGGFLPPIELPRRMWAGGRLSFHEPLAVGAEVRRVSTIKSVVRKAGASGDMVFVTVGHQVSVGGVLAISEEHDIVYRGATGAAPASTPDERVATDTRVFSTDSVTLFRYSALTFNAHRIHYDRDYATDVEGYPGLVVHGPLIATLLIDHARRRSPKAKVRTFSFRAQRPLFDGEQAQLCANDLGEVWCLNALGAAVMSARVEFD